MSKDDENVNKSLEKLQEALEKMPDGVGKAVMAGIKSVINEDRAAQVAASKLKDEEDDFDDENLNDDEDLEKLSRAELIQHLDKRFGKALEKSLKPVLKQLEKTSDSADADRIRTEFKEAAAKHPDFMEFKDEIGKILQTNPNMTAERMYLLAKAENPEKAKELQDKDQKIKDAEDAKTKTAFGGLTPTSGTSSVKSEKMDQKQAGESAWESVMAGVPAEILGDQL